MSLGAATIWGAGQVKIQTSGWQAGSATAATDELKKPIGLSITGLSDVYRWGDMNTPTYGYALFTNPTTITGNNGVTLQTMGDVTNSRMVISASEIKAPNGQINLQSVGDMRLESGEEEIFDTTSRSYKTGKWYNRKYVVETNTFKDQSASPDILQGASIAVKSGGSLDAFATQFLARSGNISLVAANGLNLFAVDAVAIDKVDKEVKKKFIGIRYDKTTTSSSREVSQPLPVRVVAQSASTASGWNTLLQGTQFQTSLSGANIQAGVGANARADAVIILQGIKNTVTQNLTQDSNYVVWQNKTNVGSKVETLTLPTFIGPSTPTLIAPGGVVVDVPYTTYTNTVSTNGKVNTLTTAVGQPGTLSVAPPVVGNVATPNTPAFQGRAASTSNCPKT